MAPSQASSLGPGSGNLEKLLPELEALYKDVHSHPELSMQETRTAALAADHLRAAGFEVTIRCWKDWRRRPAPER